MQNMTENRVGTPVKGLLALVFVGLSTSMGAYAQDGDVIIFDEITVTAQKREQSAQDVPMGLSVIGAQDIRDRSVSNMAQSFDVIPNAYFEEGVQANPTIVLRGVSTNTNNFGIEPGVGMAIDDVFLGRPTYFSTALIDVERIEVLRGPQGTLFGRNTTGGLINVVTRKPSHEFDAAADLTAGSDNLGQFRGYLSGSLAEDKVAGKISATIKKADGWADNRTDGFSDFQDVDFHGVRGQLLFTPADDVNILFTAEHSENDGIQNFQDIIGGPLAALDGNNAFDRSIATNRDNVYNRKLTGYSLNAEWQWGDVTVTSITSDRESSWMFGNDQDYSLADFLFTSRVEEQEQFSQEFRFTSPADRNFSWVLGLYYFDQELTGADEAILGQDIPPAFGAPAIPGYEESGRAASSIDTTSIAAFASGTWVLSDNLTLTAGLRFTDEEKDFNIVQTVEVFEVAPGFPVGIIFAFAPPFAPVAADLSDSNVSGDMSLMYAFNDSVNGYFRYARGFKAGGFDSTFYAAPPTPGDVSFDAETIDNFEIGIKSILADGRLRLNASIFHMSWDDKQEQFFNNGTFLTANAAKASSSGAEVELNALLGNSWEVIASLGYLNAEYDEFTDPIIGTDLSGNKLQDSPDLSGLLALQYTGNRDGAWNVFGRVEARYRDDTFTGAGGNPLFEADSNTVVNARLGLTSPSDRFSIAVWGRNLTDEDYVTGGFNFISDYVGVNTPRSVAVEVSVRY